MTIRDASRFIRFADNPHPHVILYNRSLRLLLLPSKKSDSDSDSDDEHELTPSTIHLEFKDGVALHERWRPFSKDR